MIKIGLTGSIAMGKSFVAKVLAAMNYPVYDSDLIIAELIKCKARPLIGKYFPQVMIDNKVDKNLLAQIVFGDKKKLRLLESILHPLERNKRDEFIKQTNRLGKEIAVFVVPLLFEKKYMSEFDYIIVTSCDRNTQTSRALKRRDMTKAKLKSIMAAQMSDHKKRIKADFIIYTGLSKAHTIRQIITLTKEITCVK